MPIFRLNLNKLLALILERINGSIHRIVITNNNTYNNKPLDHLTTKCYFIKPLP